MCAVHLFRNEPQPVQFLCPSADKLPCLVRPLPLSASSGAQPHSAYPHSAAALALAAAALAISAPALAFTAPSLSHGGTMLKHLQLGL